MITKNFEDFKNHVLRSNSYFSKGYANCFKDVETNKILLRIGNNFKEIFPDDKEGNYFYLRNEPAISFQADRAKATSDCGIGRLGFLDTITTYLVAIVNGADEYELISNLRNTAMAYPNMNIIPTSSIWMRENVINQEMSGFEAETQLKVFSRLKDQTIVRITLQIQSDFIPDNCIINPCKSC